MPESNKYGIVDVNGKHTAIVKANAEQETKIYEELVKQRLATETKMHEERLKLMEATRKAIADAEREGDKEAVKHLKRQLGGYKAQETQYQKELEKLRSDATKRAIAFEQAQYQKMSARKRMEANKSVAAELNSRKEAIQLMYSVELAEFEELQSRKESLTDDEQKRLNTLTDNLSDVQAELSDIDTKLPIAQAAFDDLFSRIATSADKVAAAKEKYDESELKAQEAKAELQNFEAENLKKLRDARRNGDKETAKALEKEWKERQELADTTQKQADADKKRLKDAEKAAAKEDERQKKKDDAEKKRQELFDSFDPSKNRKQIDDNLNAIYGDQAKYLAKLEGSNENWRKSVDNVSDAIGFSGIVSKKNVIGKMKELVDSGIAYNIEMRAFLAETSENIASTFEATNGTLLRMIRLQQQDSTAARLGMEATLTKLFNRFFEDSSYLKDVADNVSSAILDASATMSRDMSLEFEYTMQKWLGSLYSLGMSGDAIQSIATGINYLGTGNVTALNSNAPLQTLLAMSASKSGGKSYADILTTGLTSDDTNKLLRAMIEYLAEIARSQGNMVTKSAYAELFGMSVTDLSAFASLTTSEIQSLYKNTVSYKDLIDETETRLSQIGKNMSLSDLVDTAIDNAQVGVATTIGSTAFTYGTWKALGLLQDYVGEIPIPGILAAGFGISSAIDLLNVAQTAMAGMGLLGSLLGGLGSMLNGGVTNIANWDFQESTSRGGSLTLLNRGSTTNTSYSAVLGVGGATGDTLSSVSMESAKSKAMEESGITSEEIEEGKEIPQKIYDALAGDSTPTVLSLLQEIDDRLDPSRVFYTAISGVLSRDTVSQVTNLSAQLATARATIEPTDEQGSTTNDSTKSATGVTVSGSTQSQTPSNVISQALSGNGISPLDGAVVDLSSMITDAVAAALNSVLTSNSYSGIPVRITNGG